MPVKTTVLRLERQIREEHLRALEATRLEWERLASELINAARRRGYAGDDPYLALQSLCAHEPEARRLARAVGELWLTFFGCLDPHGGAPVAEFRSEADALNKRLAQAPAVEGPDPALAADVVETLDAFWASHQQQVAERLERLAASSGHKAADELQAALTAERASCQRAGQDARATVEAMAAFLAALGQAIEGRPAAALPGRAQTMIEAVLRLGAARHELVGQVAELRTQVGQLAAERRELLEEIASRDAALVRAQSGVTADLDLDAASAAAVVLACDRHLAGLARHLGELRAVLQLTDDPRRFRPRLFSAGYDFKGLPGQTTALRDAAQDLLAFADRARWALGVRRLGQAAPKLRAVFQELVRLIAAWRSKLGDPPPVSATMQIRAADSVCALPAVAAADVEALVRRRSGGDRAAAELTPILEPCVALLHRTLGEARGSAPGRPEAPKHESARASAQRLAHELADYAGRLEAAFSEALLVDFHLPAAEAKLLGDEQLIRLALGQLDGACAELAVLDGIPAPELAAMPTRGDLDAILAAARTRADWLERVASCRFRVS